MTVSNITRRAGPFVGNGTIKTFPFPFKIFNERQVLVYESDDGVTDRTLAYGTDYFVTLDAEAGGIVTLTNPLEAGKRIAILSNVPYDQQMVLTNRGGFYPTVINDAVDKLCAQIQQIFELATRHLTVPATSDKTAEEVLTEVLDTAASAGEYAKQAAETLKSANDLYAEMQKELPKVTAEGDKQVDRVGEAGEERIEEVNSAVVAEGDRQLQRLDQATEWTLVGYGIGCEEERWTVGAPIASGSEVTLPNGMTYLVGHHHLRLSVNGAVCHKPTNFEEIGMEQSVSTKFRILFDLEPGDEVMAWTVPLGRGDSAIDYAERIASLESALADLSRAVVYKEDENGN